jgi:hypothetical protein
MSVDGRASVAREQIGRHSISRLLRSLVLIFRCRPFQRRLAQRSREPADEPGRDRFVIFNPTRPSAWPKGRSAQEINAVNFSLSIRQE